MTKGKLCLDDRNVAQNGFSEAISGATIPSALRDEVQNSSGGVQMASGKAILDFIWGMLVHRIYGVFKCAFGTLRFLNWVKPFQIGNVCSRAQLPAS